MGFAQHQSFYLRDGWLRKGMSEVKENETFFHNPEAYERIGLGKNMVQSLRYWMQACGVGYEKENKERKRVMNLTKFGKLLNEYDPFLELSESISILHYYIVKDKTRASTWYWFFQSYKEQVFSKEQLIEDLTGWVAASFAKSTALTSLKKDIDCLLRMYTLKDESHDPEEIIESPMSRLNLLSQTGEVYQREKGSHQLIGLPALYYVLLDYCREKEQYEISLEEIMTSPLWGNIFQFERSESIEVLEKLSVHEKYPIRFTRTNELNIIHVPRVEPEMFLQQEYERTVKVLDR